MDKLMSVKEYAELRGVTKDAVIKALAKKRALVGVNEAKLIGNSYVLSVDTSKVKK